MAAVEQPVDHLNKKLDSLKIKPQAKSGDITKVTAGKDGALPIHTSELLRSSIGVPASEIEMKGPVVSYASTGFIYPHGNIYGGSQPSVVHMHGYTSYPIEGVHFHNPDLQAVDYSFVSQPYSPSAPGMQFQPHGNNGYLYGPHVFQYPVHPYYQQAPPGSHYLPPFSGVPAGGVIMSEFHDARHPMSIGQTSMNSFGGSISCLPITMLPPPPVPSEKGAMPVSVSFTATPGVRLSAPALTEPLKKQKEWPKPSSPPGVQAQHSSPANPVQTDRSPAAVHPPARNETLPRVGTPCTGVTTNQCTPKTPNCGSTAKIMDSKSNSGDVDCSRQIVSRQQVKGNGSLSNNTGHSDVLNEQNKDAQVLSGRSQQTAPLLQSTRAQDVSVNKVVGICCPPDRGNHNKLDLATKYDDAKFFIIKSYSEDNVHKSIKHNVWASTASGNKKLDEAYQDAQRRAEGKPQGCPVFLFFSVNGSRQFCGVAEMVGPVDYCKTMEFWEQHKWSGSFPVKWHIIKDLPNSQLRRIILENNENKPVTNSRDTQEVKFQQGLEMLNIYSSYPARTSILDEFHLHLNRQKAAQDMKPHQWSPQSFPKLSELAVKEKEIGEVDESKIVKASSASSKGCDSETKEVTGQRRPDNNLVKVTATTRSAENDRLEKENLEKISKKEESREVPK